MINLHNTTNATWQMRTNVLGLAAAFALFPHLTEAGTYDVEDNWTSGGVVSVYARKVEQFRRDGTKVRIQTNGCTSACTYFLLAWDVCVSPKTRFEFHGPQNAITAYLGIPGPTHKKGAQIMANDYNSRWPGLGDWFLERAAHRTGILATTVTGQALHNAFGVPLCEEE